MFESCCMRHETSVRSVAMKIQNSHHHVSCLMYQATKNRKVLRWGCVESLLSMKAHTIFQLGVEERKTRVVGRVGYDVKFAVVFPQLSIGDCWRSGRDDVDWKRSMTSTKSIPSIYLPSSGGFSTNYEKKHTESRLLVTFISKAFSWYRDVR